MYKILKYDFNVFNSRWRCIFKTTDIKVANERFDSEYNKLEHGGLMLSDDETVLKVIWCPKLDSK